MDLPQDSQMYDPSYKFPFPVLIIAAVWILLTLLYAIAKWRQTPKNMYIIPRVFVLCSPRTVQFHYELILRVGLPSAEFKPDKHDIDVTVNGQQKNEVVPMTRLNTKTLYDEPLITSLSIIVYRLVEMPPLGYLVLRHSGPYRASLYVYDFTVIDLSTNKEQYYTINQYIGSLSRLFQLEDGAANVHYPIDDVPLPQWTSDDTYLILYALVNCVMLSMMVLPINCSYLNDVASILLATLNGCCVVFFLDWLLYYYSRWDAERREYFNIEGSRLCPSNGLLKVIVATCTTFVGAIAIYLALPITDMRDTLVWALASLNACILVVGFASVARQADLGQTIVEWGLKLRGIEMESAGMKYSEMISDFGTKSGSTSIDGLDSSLSTARGLGPRSSVKSFGFDAVTGHPSRRVAASMGSFSRLTSANSTATLTVPPPFPSTPAKALHAHHQEASAAPAGQPPAAQREDKSTSKKRSHWKEDSAKNQQQRHQSQHHEQHEPHHHQQQQQQQQTSVSAHPKHAGHSNTGHDKHHKPESSGSKRAAQQRNQ